MGLKSLFFVDNDANKTKSESAEPVSAPVNKFPTSNDDSNGTMSFPSTTNMPVFGQPDNQHLDKIVEMYQNGFDSLNQPGYDFYEFFQAIINSGGIDNPQMYLMAMSMGSAMDKTNTKTKLLTQADFYLNEINKVYNQNVSAGSSKKQELVTQKDNENQSLNSDLSNLKAQLEAINNQIRTKQGQLSLIDNKYQPLISDIDAKLNANETAKTTLINNITKVKEGINNNIK